MGYEVTGTDQELVTKIADMLKEEERLVGLLYMDAMMMGVDANLLRSVVCTGIHHLIKKGRLALIRRD